MGLFVSYSYVQKNNSFGFGSCEFTEMKKPTEFSEIRKITKYIMEQNPEYKGCVILNYEEMGK